MHYQFDNYPGDYPSLNPEMMAIRQRINLLDHILDEYEEREIELATMEMDQ